MLKPGPRNLITDVAGIAVGNAEDEAVRTGVTVLACPGRAVAAVDQRGGAPGTRETDLLDPANRIEAIDAIVLSGGSVFGLDAAGAVARALSERGVGLLLGGEGVPAIPIVPAAILFDLMNGGDKRWTVPPYQALGLQALDAAGPDFALGNAGAGYGGRAGRLKGGLGSASTVDGESGAVVGALAAVNAVGSPVIPGTSTLWAWACERDGEMGGQKPPAPGAIAHTIDLPIMTRPRGDGNGPGDGGLGRNTTLAVVATDAALTKVQARRMAIQAQDGLALATRPSHTAFDGDTVFVMSTGDRPVADDVALARLGAIAAETVARAIGRAVWEARTLGPLRSYRDTFGL